MSALAYIKEQTRMIRGFSQGCTTGYENQHFLHPPMTHSIFTHIERTVKRHTVADAIKQAGDVLAKHYDLKGLCLNKVQNNSRDKLITLSEMSDLVEELVNDSLYHAGRWH